MNSEFRFIHKTETKTTTKKALKKQEIKLVIKTKTIQTNRSFCLIPNIFHTLHTPHHRFLEKHEIGKPIVFVVSIKKLVRRILAYLHNLWFFFVVVTFPTVEILC